MSAPANDHEAAPCAELSQWDFEDPAERKPLCEDCPLDCDVRAGEFGALDPGAVIRPLL